MNKPCLIRCNGASLDGLPPEIQSRKVISLDGQTTESNVNILYEDIPMHFRKDLAPRQLDLLEIAAYIYAADCAISRGTGWDRRRATESWERDFHFVIAVRDISFWNLAEVKTSLIKVLAFLSSDKYDFSFVGLKKEIEIQKYIELTECEVSRLKKFSKVILFSGGLDSLAGAVQCLSRGEHIVLVSHRSANVMNSRLRRLVDELRKLYPDQLLHIPVWVNKDGHLSKESTQRARTFLYSTLGVLAGYFLDVNSINFYENGIVSLNIPVADEVVRSRATRTTHPKSLFLFSKFYSLFSGGDVRITNPFLYKTKTEVVRIIKESGNPQLISYSRSCAHTRFVGKGMWHCGACSQCIDRRIAIYAADCVGYEDETDYAEDVFVGKRKEKYERSMGINYARHAVALKNMSLDEIMNKFQHHLHQASRYSSSRKESFVQLAEIHKKHGELVDAVLNLHVQKNAGDLINGKLDKSCLVSLIAGGEHLKTVWYRYVSRVVEILSQGLTKTYRTEKPKNEKRLQEACDGLLASANDNILIREFPYVRWASKLTKPDWGSNDLTFFIELKYVSKREYVGRIQDEIAADITEYSGDGRQVLFIVYDPSHFIDNEKALKQTVEQHEMFIDFIR